MPIIETVFLTGPGLHDVALAMLRATVGVFFAISGFHKLFNHERHASLVKTLEDSGIPFVRFNQWWVPGVEFVAGVALTLGFLTLVSAAMLGAICLVATCTDGLKRIREWKPINKADWLDTFLYLPEVIYGLKIAAILLVGPGAYSLDAALL